MRLAVDVLDDAHHAVLDDEHFGAEVAFTEDDVAGRVRCRRVLHHDFLPPGSLEDGFHRCTAGAVIVNVPSLVLTRTGAPIGISRLLPKCPKGRSRTTGIPLDPNFSWRRAVTSGSLPQPFSAPIRTPRMRRNLPDRSRWV